MINKCYNISNENGLLYWAMNMKAEMAGYSDTDLLIKYLYDFQQGKYQLLEKFLTDIANSFHKNKDVRIRITSDTSDTVTIMSFEIISEDTEAPPVLLHCSTVKKSAVKSILSKAVYKDSYAYLFGIFDL